MIRVAADTVVDAPVERAWRLYEDIANTPTWVPFVEEVLSIEGGPGVGTVYRERTRLGGLTGVQEWRIVEHRAPRLTVHVSTDMGMDARLSITFERAGPDGRHTRIRQVTELRSRLRPLRWLHEALFALGSRHGVRGAVRGAKAALERDGAGDAVTGEATGTRAT